MLCPKCQSENPEGSIFCNKCAQKLDSSLENITAKTGTKGERKYATILFSDLSGYTAMTEKMDPEEVKNLMGDIFKKAGAVVKKYEGTVERFFGDEIMILFGVPKAHEDDTIRAIHTAIEIHKLVDKLSLDFEKKYKTKLSMHTGINTGLVITGDEYIGKGRHGLTGDTINLAKRLTSLANSGEIIVGQDTYKIAQNHFSFELRDPVTVKGKKDSVSNFKVIDAVEKPKRIKRLHGVRAKLIGRNKELSIFNQAVTELKNGTGSVLCLYGFAGTGKSRLIEEFQAISNIQWFEGYTYPYTQSIPYFPLLTLFDDIFGMKEEDSPKTIKAKIDKTIRTLVKDPQAIIPYIGTLYSLSYPEVESVSPEFWKSKLFDAVCEILSALSKHQAIIICIEDLHWADPSFLELVDHIQSKAKLPILFLYVARPAIEIFSSFQIDQIKTKYQEIKIEDLSASDSQVMVKSLLKSKSIPPKLKSFVEKKTQGNPFYLEEMINFLIESKVLLKNENEWILDREITESDISSSIHGVISARVDRLESESKRILQEASVVGRSFYYEIIHRITDTKKDINHCLQTLEGFDLIKSRENKLDLEYIFKHALTQEVVYKGLLKTERQIIHEKIGIVIENFFGDRLPEFYETLAHHFMKGKSKLKAVDYLKKSGDKSIKKYSVDEAHQYYQKAFDLINSITDKSIKINESMIDLLNRWALVYYYSGDYKNLGDLFSSQGHLADQINDKEIIGMFYAWQGNIFWFRSKYIKAKKNLEKAVLIGTEINNKKIIGYACAWLSWLFADMGFFKKGIEYGQKANEIGENYKEDHYIYFKSLGGIGFISYCMGEAQNCIEVGEKLIRYGDEYSQIRSLGMGHCTKGIGYTNSGDFEKGVSLLEEAIKISSDPVYRFGFRTILLQSLILNKEMEKAKDVMNKALRFHKNNRVETFGDIASFLNGVILIDSGRITKGFNIIKEYEQVFIKQQKNGILPMIKYIKGKIFLKIIQGNEPLSFVTLIKNIGFIIKNVPFAEKKALRYYSESIELAKKIGADGVKAQAHLDLGIIHKIKNRHDLAKKHLQKAIHIFEKIGAFKFLKQANKELNQLNYYSGN